MKGIDIQLEGFGKENKCNFSLLRMDGCTKWVTNWDYMGLQMGVSNTSMCCMWARY
jgi:hypothetical protein